MLNSQSKENMMDRKQFVKEIAKAIRGAAPESRAILYGSEARGDSRPNSDFDVLILLPDDNPNGSFVKRRGEICDSLYDLEDKYDFQFEVSPLILKESVWGRRKTHFTVNVNNEGIPL